MLFAYQPSDYSKIVSRKYRLATNKEQNFKFKLIKSDVTRLRFIVVISTLPLPLYSNSVTGWYSPLFPYILLILNFHALSTYVDTQPLCFANVIEIRCKILRVRKIKKPKKYISIIYKSDAKEIEIENFSEKVTQKTKL